MLCNAVKATVAYRGKMLVIMHDDPAGIWAGVPGGSIEEGEDSLTAMRREFMEEICIVPSQIISLEVTHNEDGAWCQRYFAPLTDQEAISVSLGDEGFELQWLTFEEMLECKLSPLGRAYYESDAGQGVRRLIDKTVAES